MKLAVLILAFAYAIVMNVAKFMIALFCAMAFTLLNVLLFRDIFIDRSSNRKREAA